MQRRPDANRSTAAETRAVEVARRLFAERGLAGVNMDLIATEAGIARQTLYNRFGSKQAVFRAALDAHWASLGAAAQARLDPARDPRAVLAEVAGDVLAFIRDRDQVAMTRTVVAESRTHPEVARTFFEHGKGPLLARFVQYLGEAGAAGALACPDAELAARQFLGMIQESLLWPLVMGTGEPEPDAGEVVDGAIEVFLRAYAVDRVPHGT